MIISDEDSNLAQFKLGLEMDSEEEADLDSSKLETPFDPTNVDIINKPFTISALLERLKYSELKLTPDFQRRANLWDEARKSRLIESILLRIPLPSFYFSEDQTGNFEVVDGLQRLCAIFHFVDVKTLNSSTKSKLNPLQLSGLQYLTEQENCTFDDLNRQFQRRINELEINVNIIRATTPKAVMFNVFARLNQGGLPLTAQEIRNAIYPGRWRDEIRNIAEGEHFLRATKNKVPTDRQQDMEMVLRFVALWSLGKGNIRPPNQVLDKFLNDTVEKRINNWGASEWKVASDAFSKGLHATIEIFGDHAFRKSIPGIAKSPINKGLFESQLITLSELSETQIKKLIEKRVVISENFMRLISREGKFSNALRSGTGHSDASNSRLEGLRNIFLEVLND